MEDALANLKLSADAAAEAKFVALGRNELSTLDARIVAIIVRSVDATWPDNELEDAGECAMALDWDVATRQAGDASLYCLYAYVTFRRVAMCVYKMHASPANAAFTSMLKWFDECATGMQRKTVEEAISAAGHVMSTMELDDDAANCVAGFFSSACYLMEFVNKYKQ